MDKSNNSGGSTPFKNSNVSGQTENLNQDKQFQDDSNPRSSHASYKDQTMESKLDRDNPDTKSSFKDQPMSGNVTSGGSFGTSGGQSGSHDPTSAGRFTSGNSTSGKVSQGNPMEDIGKMDLSPSAAGYGDPKSFQAKGTDGSKRLDERESERVDTRDPTSSFQDPMYKSEKSDKSDTFRSDQSYRSDKDSSSSWNQQSDKNLKSDTSSWNNKSDSSKSDKSDTSSWNKSDKDSSNWNSNQSNSMNQSDKNSKSDKSDSSSWNNNKSDSSKSDTSSWNKSDKDSSTWNSNQSNSMNQSDKNSKSDTSSWNNKSEKKSDPTSDRMDLSNWKSADSDNIDSSKDSKDMKVEHNAEKHEFIVRLSGGEDAKLSYKEIGKDKVDFFRTYVPPQQRHQEIGQKLGEHALDWAKQKNLKTKLSCDFLSSKFSEDPKYEKIIATE